MNHVLAQDTAQHSTSRQLAQIFLKCSNLQQNLNYIPQLPYFGDFWQDMYTPVNIYDHGHTQSPAVHMQDKVMWRARLGWMEGMPDWDTE